MINKLNNNKNDSRFGKTRWQVVLAPTVSRVTVIDVPYVCDRLTFWSLLYVDSFAKNKAIAEYVKFRLR